MAVIAHTALRADQSDTVAAVFEFRRAYFYAEEKRTTFVGLPDNVPADVRISHVRKLRAVASRGDELRKGLVSCGLMVGDVSRCCFRNQSGSVAGPDA